MAQEREARVTFDTGSIAFRLERLQGREELARPFRYEAQLLSDDIAIKLPSLLGKPLVIEIDGHGGTVRYCHGLVERATFLGAQGTVGRYLLTVVPWLQFLDRRQDCRIFQNKTVLEILAEVFDAYGGLATYRNKTVGHYPTYEYCVQYRESDLNFVMRLMEEAGIYYFFEHEQSAHTLTLMDHVGQHSTRSQYADVPYYPPDDRRRRERDLLDDWQAGALVTPGTVTVRSFDFEQPANAVTSTDTAPKSHSLADAEVFDYPGDFVKTGDLDPRTEVRREELQSDWSRSIGRGNAVGLCCGYKFTLRNHERADQNIEWLIVAVECTVTTEAGRSGAQRGEDPYRSTIVVQNTTDAFRPARLASRPFVHGPQTAIVTGPSGEEIYTDKYGRVKIQFHWDRQGKKDENSSCWVRVSQGWAGTGFGMIHLPRIGQEVIVDFLEGDPDRPIITGRVYNALAMPPYTLPDKATQSGIKSNSSKGGGGFNELRFEDNKGKEEVYFQAQRVLTGVVRASESWSVGSSRTTTIGKNDTYTLKDGDLKMTLDKGSELVTISKGDLKTDILMGSEFLTISKGDLKTTLDMGSTSFSQSLGDFKVDAMAGTAKVEAKSVVVTGLLELKLSCGASTISMNPGMITIQAPMVKIN